MLWITGVCSYRYFADFSEVEINEDTETASSMQLGYEGLQGEAGMRMFGETDWHRGWKQAFPLEMRERTFLNKSEGYCHRADVFTACGTAIEFQNSPISLRELISREGFYPKMVWVVNGAKFKGFRVLKNLPSMEDPGILGFEFSHTANLTMVRKCDILAGMDKPKVLTFHHPELRSLKRTGHLYSFRWLKPHRVWYQARFPIVIDFGGYFLYELRHRPQLNGDYAYLCMVPKKDFIARYITVQI